MILKRNSKTGGSFRSPDPVAHYRVGHVALLLRQRLGLIKVYVIVPTLGYSEQHGFGCLDPLTGPTTHGLGAGARRAHDREHEDRDAQGAAQQDAPHLVIAIYMYIHIYIYIDIHICIYIRIIVTLIRIAIITLMRIIAIMTTITTITVKITIIIRIVPRTTVIISVEN